MEEEIRNEETAMIPFYVHEGEINRLERINKRFFALLLIVFLALVGTNAGWIIYESQFEDVVVTQENADGVNNYVGRDGDIINGKADNPNPPEEGAQRDGTL